MKHKIAILLIVCLLSQVTMNFSWVNAAQVNTLKLDGEKRGGTTQSSITYNLSPEKCGIVHLYITYDSTSPVKATLKNLSSNVEKTFESSCVDQKSIIDFTYYAEVVKYQLTLEFKNGDINTRYSVMGDLKALSSGESTKGNTLESAIRLGTPDQIQGILGFGDIMDCYMVTLNSEDNLKIKLRNYGQESINLKVYNTYKELLKLETIGTNVVAYEYELPQANGNYYLMIDRVYTNGPGTNYSLTTGDYVAVESVKLPMKALTLTAGSSKVMKATVAPSNATEKVLYKSSNKKIATVNEYGKIVAVKAGKATITAYSTNGGVKANLKLTVKAKAVTKVSLNATKKSLEVGKTFQLKPKVAPSGVTTTYTYKSSNSDIAKVNGKGLVTAVKKGTCSITITTKNGKAAKCQITTTQTVTPTPKPVVTHKPTPTPKPTPKPSVAVTSIKAKSNMFMLKVKDTKQITYTIAPSNATETDVVFSCQNPKIATVDQKGVVTAASSGTTIVNATTKNGKTMFVTIIVY